MGSADGYFDRGQWDGTHCTFCGAFFLFLFIWSILFLLSLLLPIPAVSGLPPVITVLSFLFLYLAPAIIFAHSGFIFFGCFQPLGSHSWLIISSGFLLLANLRAISYEWATQAPCRHYPSSSTSASLSHLLIPQTH